jgi:hypothetical protein
VPVVRFLLVAGGASRAVGLGAYRGRAVPHLSSSMPIVLAPRAHLLLIHEASRWNASRACPACRFIIVPAHAIEVDKMDYMVCVQASSKKLLSHNGFEFNCLVEALFDPGYLDAARSLAGG